MNTLFGLELPTSVNFVIAFVVVLGLIGVATWAVRRFGGTRLEAAVRNRQPRLAVLDSAMVDSRRRLVIIRRDNVEHLLMVGGASDVVVETNIVRASVAARDPGPARAGVADTMPRPMALPEATPWPLQPESAPAAPAAPIEGSRNADDVAAWPAPAPAIVHPIRPPRPPDPLVMATDITRPVVELVAPPRPVASAPPVEPVGAASDDQDLAEMAHRLETALRKPLPGAQKSPPVPGPRPIAEIRAVPKPEPAPVEADPKSAFKSLEQEMASLLGRPGKT